MSHFLGNFTPKTIALKIGHLAFQVPTMDRNSLNKSEMHQIKMCACIFAVGGLQTHSSRDGCNLSPKHPPNNGELHSLGRNSPKGGWYTIVSLCTCSLDHAHSICPVSHIAISKYIAHKNVLYMGNKMLIINAKLGVLDGVHMMFSTPTNDRLERQDE